MNIRVNADYVAKQASSAAGEIVTEIEKVHGPIWAGRQELCKLIISLASAIVISIAANLLITLTLSALLEKRYLSGTVS